MKEKIYFTIVVATHNDENFIKATLDSIALQECRDYEVVVVDGGSKDRSLEVVYQADFPHRKVYSFFEPDIYYMWNKAIKLARGRYILFFKAGTYFTSSRMLEQLKADIAALEEPDLVTTCGMGYHRKTRGMHTPPIGKRRLTRGILPTMLGSRLFRTDTLRSLGGFDTNFTVRASFELVCRYVATPSARVVALNYVITDYIVKFTESERFLEYHRETPGILAKNFGWVKLMTYLISHSTWIAFRYWLGNLHFHSADEIG